jgi:hypothetical protein
MIDKGHKNLRGQFNQISLQRDNRYIEAIVDYAGGKESKMTRKTGLFIISLFMMLGGLVRLLANQSVFRIFGMDHLWFAEPFALYNYRLLGVFVLWMGLVLFVCSRDVIRHTGIIRVSILGLIVFFVVSLLSGFAAALDARFFLVDSIFSLILIVLLFIIQRK